MSETPASLYERVFGCKPTLVENITGSGSGRRYTRLSAPGFPSAIGTEGTVLAENYAFVMLDETFRERNLPVPKIYAISQDRMTYLQSDVGTRSLFEMLPSRPHEIITAVMRLLPHFQKTEGVNFEACYPVEAMDAQAMLWDLNYFKYCFLMAAGITPDEPALERDFKALIGQLTTASPIGLMLRDFQSRNIIVNRDNRPYFIDFQGARRGPKLYDAASFLWQAKAGFSDAERREYSAPYLQQIGCNFDTLRLYALLRTLQVLGAYGFRGLVQGKSHFITSITPALKNLAGLIDLLAPYPELQRCCSLLATSPLATETSKAGLTVHIASFGFRKSGPPTDLSGNGGGFVFDCRVLPNPGRLDEFKPQTGRDIAVKQWLEVYPEVDTFFTNALALVEPSVKRYLQRGFNSLSVSFGCTGGQHRSVYMAERLAQELSKTEGVNIELNHCESASWPENQK